MNKSRRIVFRVSPQLHDFLVEFAEMKDLKMSDMIRNIINYWYMAYYTGDLNIEYDNLKEKFTFMVKNLPKD